ncbi:coiled-coil domain-containing protein [Hymenobacter siberiensis]|uniref:hypothetical protein n=1 Tax=Hymenobacter siberiensis TaxID=2848396 RepID=UPI001C1E0C17|nr:hypothetical protein [Hymenobacter siberiensis]
METTQAHPLTLVLDQSGLPQRKAEIIHQQFSDYFAIAEQYKQEAKTLVVTGEDQTELMARARQGRLFLKAKRVAIEKTRKELKDESLQEGRAIDNVAKLLTSLIEPTEQFLLEQEEYAKRLEAARERETLAIMAERRAQLALCEAATTDRFLREATTTEFNEFAELCRIGHEQRLQDQQEEARKQREADQRNRDELLRENQRLQEEKRKQDEEIAASREALRLSLVAREEERTRENNARLEAQRQAALSQQKQQLLALGPDRDKLRALAGSIETIALPQATSAQGQEIVTRVGDLLGKVTKYLHEQSEQLSLSL